MNLEIVFVGGMVFAILFMLSGLIVFISAVYAAIVLRRRLRELGAILAGQSERRENEDPR